MNKPVKIFMTLPVGTKIEYDVILTFNSNDKSYVIYTDNTYDDNKKIRFYAAMYNKFLSNPYLGEPQTNEEWNQIIKVVDSVLKTN